jgi:AraC-like DNA-binding protein
MDALSNVLSAVRLTGAVFLDMELREQWSYLSASPREVADLLMPEADHVIPYHLITAGSCYAKLPDGEPLKLVAGDVILFPAGDRHVLAAASQAALRAGPEDMRGEVLHRLLKRGDVTAVRRGEEGSETRVVCGFLACDGRMAAPILHSLPRMLRVSLRDSDTVGWLQSSMRFSIEQSEARRPGSAMVLARLSEVMFAEAVRRYMDGLPEGQTSWLGALRDRYVGRTLALLHERPAHPWTVEELAREVGLSRSALGERFASLIGRPPMQYLTSWRIAMAAARLRQGDASILRIATDVGYESEAAFNRAFKREFGSPPATWRRRLATAGSANPAGRAGRSIATDDDAKTSS